MHSDEPDAPDTRSFFSFAKSILKIEHGRPMSDGSKGVLHKDARGICKGISEKYDIIVKCPTPIVIKEYSSLI